MADTPKLIYALPQVFVSDVKRAAEFYRDMLGFRIVYLWGDPPFYGEVERGNANFNLRHVDTPVIDPARRDAEELLSVSIPVEGDLNALFAEFKDKGVSIFQEPKKQSWGGTDFSIRDPDGNLILFASGGSQS